MQWFDDSRHQPFALESGPVGALLLHGFMGTPAEMRPLGQALSETGVSAQGILLPGFGAQLSELHRMQSNDWVEAALDAWDTVVSRHEQRVLIGFSMGASVALQVAAQRRPDRLILLAPLWKLNGGDPRVSLLPILKYLKGSIRPFEKADFSDPGLREFFGGAQPALDLDDPEVQETLRQEAEISTFVLDELRKVASVADRMAEQITVPTLVIQGVDDRTVRRSDTRDLMTWFGGRVVLHEVEGDHLIVLDDRPSWPVVRDLVVSFVAGDAL